jgi:hypothetical protein
VERAPPGSAGVPPASFPRIHPRTLFQAIPGENSLSLEKTLCLPKKRSIPGENALSPEETVYFQRKRSVSGRNGLFLEKTLCFQKQHSDPGEHGLFPERTLCIPKKRSIPGENGLSPRGQTFFGLKYGQKRGRARHAPQRSMIDRAEFYCRAAGSGSVFALGERPRNGCNPNDVSFSDLGP